MKRSQLRRLTPLRSSAGLTARTTLTRTAKVNGKSRAQRRQDAKRAAAYAVVDARSGGRCEATDGIGRCRNAATEHQHRRARGRGGSSDPKTETAANLIHTCRTHHDAAERDHSPSGTPVRIGWVIRHGIDSDPARVPVLLWCGWVLLGEDGSVTPTESSAA